MGGDSQPKHLEVFFYKKKINIKLFLKQSQYFLSSNYEALVKFRDNEVNVPETRQSLNLCSCDCKIALYFLSSDKMICHTANCNFSCCFLSTNEFIQLMTIGSSIRFRSIEICTKIIIWHMDYFSGQL